MGQTSRQDMEDRWEKHSGGAEKQQEFVGRV